MSSVGNIGVSQAMQQAVATMKMAAQSQQQTANALAEAVENGEAMAQAVSGGQNLDVSV